MPCLRTFFEPALFSTPLIRRQFLENSVNARGFLHPQPRLDRPRFDVLFEALGSPTADVQQNAIVLVHLTRFNRLQQAGGGDGAWRHDVDALDGFDRRPRFDGLLLAQRCGFGRWRP